jgi:glycine oxidase
MPALVNAAERAGVTIVENQKVNRLVMEAGSVVGIAAGDLECLAPAVILTTGAYAGSGQLAPAGVTIPVRPLRGQSVCLRAPATQPPLLRHVIWTEQVHMAQKSGGRLIVGATVEEVGFNPDVTVGGLFALLEAARRALPGVEDFSVEAVWSGFRPTSQDDAPILGESGVPGLLLAVGHHRNGILLAPATADAIAAIVMGTAVAQSAQSLNLERFGSKT